MKRIVSILMIAMLMLTSGAMAAFAQVDGNATAADEVSTEAVSEDADTNEEAVEEAAAEENLLTAAEDSGEKGTVSVTIDTSKLSENNGVYSLPVSWSAAGNAKAYDVLLNDTKVSSKVTSTSVTLGNLDKNTSYTVTVNGLNGSSVVATGTTTFKLAPENTAKLIANHGYQRTIVRWKPVDGVSKYILLRKKAGDDTYVTRATIKASKAKKEKGYIFYADKKYKKKSRKNGTKNNKYYYYKLITVKQYGNVEVRSDASKASDKAGWIRTMYIKATFKVSRTLTSHDKSHKTKTFKAGHKIKAIGVNQGRYIFKEGGHTWFVLAISMKNQKCVYTKKFNYSNYEAQHFVNDADLGSKTKWLVWTNLYTQHTYVFKRKNKKSDWILQTMTSGSKKGKAASFECGSGSAKRSTPTGYKELWQHISIRHSRKWWSSFSAINSYHSKLSNQGLGRPASNGCIRMQPWAASYIYHKVPLKTRAYIF